jgi:Ras-related protein Rab-7L1
MSLDHQRNCIIKIVVVGNANAGKTSIIKRYCYNEMTKNYKATIGTDFAVKTITINNVTVMIQFV